MTLGKSLALALGLLELLAHDANAAPSEARTCIAANEKGLALRHAGKLIEARAQFASCTESRCPDDVRGECEKELLAEQGRIPTLVFEPKDEAGRDLDATDVSVDGVPAVRLDGRELELDPGPHEFVFTVSGKRARKLSLVLRVGEKARREPVILESTSSDAPSSQSAAPVASRAPFVNERPPTLVEDRASPVATPRSNAWTVPAVVAGSVGVVAVGVGSVFGVMAFGDKSAQQSNCATTANCPHWASAETDAAHEKRDALVSTAAIAGGGALIAAAVTMFVLRKHNENPTSLVVSSGPIAAGVGATLVVGGRF